ncbi:hypothetical protein ACFW7J_20045 [Streptomyces sp. NPDC059525]|uniref:hypothetical protein n=1 Tax=Streptomyces sp. NPDC059525 TaxID=3346857 RepID=UPI00368F0315
MRELLEVAGDDDGALDLLPPAYRRILALVENAHDGLRSQDFCRALGLGSEPRHHRPKAHKPS